MDNQIDHARLIVNPFIICGVALLVAVLLQWAIPLPFLPSPMAWIIGLIVFLSGFGFGLPAFRLMRKAKTSPNPNHPSTALITQGTFRYSRNPIYVAQILNYAGLAILFQSLWGLLFLPVVGWMMTRWVIIPEEDYLSQKFGESYLHYKESVRRWI